MSSNLPQVSFPYPKQGDVERPPGQGCIACVHKTYCPAIFWYRTDGTQVDEHTGRRCASWSDNPMDKVTTVTEDDLDENEYLWDTGVIGGENQTDLAPFGSEDDIGM